jgi:hypothetical protein
VRKCGLAVANLGQGLLAGSCEHGNELSIFEKMRGISCLAD